ncbi:hypothetical protein EV363DRAFT_451607 [Boletus edulis]|nr:hypothetical protein EV363DRAFT_451607 [Boletus edulis]
MALFSDGYGVLDVVCTFADEPCLQFVGPDPDQLAGKFGLVDTTGSGDWKQPPIGSTDATFSKAKGSSTARIIGGALPWVAEFELPEAFVEIEIKDVKGELRYHKANRIKHGSYVRWISDHLIFFEDDIRSIDYTAYFMALNDPELTELMPAEHQDVTVHGVQWTPPTY